MILFYKKVLYFIITVVFLILSFMKNSSSEDIKIPTIKCKIQEIGTLDLDGAQNPKWSPDGTKIAFVMSKESGWDTNDKDVMDHERILFVINADGTNMKRLTDRGDISNFQWAHDSKEIVLGVAFINVHSGEVRFMKYDRPAYLKFNGKFKETVNYESGRINVLSFAWEEGLAGIYELNEDGSLKKIRDMEKIKKFIKVPKEEGFSTWEPGSISPDVKKIIYDDIDEYWEKYGKFDPKLKDYEKDKTHLPLDSERFNKLSFYVQSFDKEDKKFLVKGGQGFVWSYDGEKIAFLKEDMWKDRFGEEEGRDYIFVCDSNGSNLIKLDINVLLYDNESVDKIGGWSPDNNKLVIELSYKASETRIAIVSW